MLENITPLTYDVAPFLCFLTSSPLMELWMDSRVAVPVNLFSKQQTSGTNRGILEMIAFFSEVFLTSLRSKSGKEILPPYFGTSFLDWTLYLVHLLQYNVFWCSRADWKDDKPTDVDELLIERIAVVDLCLSFVEQVWSGLGLFLSEFISVSASIKHGVWNYIHHSMAPWGISAGWSLTLICHQIKKCPAHVVRRRVQGPVKNHAFSLLTDIRHSVSSCTQNIFPCVNLPTVVYSGL